MAFFDTHAHYEDSWFDADRQEVISCLPASGVQFVMNCGSDGTTSKKSVDLAHQYGFFYAAVGWHPHEAGSWDACCAQRIRDWAKDSKVRAIGEIGLDYHYDFEWKQLQNTVFEAQMCLAEELDLPVVVHDREAHGDTLGVIRRYPAVRGEFHCYSGSAEMAKEILDRGWYLGFNGAITMPGARRSLETIAMMPADRILLETDCPYLAPMPRLDGKRNDSRKLPRVAEVIAEVRNTNPEDIAETALRNGRRFFGI